MPSHQKLKPEAMIMKPVPNSQKESVRIRAEKHKSMPNDNKNQTITGISGGGMIVNELAM